MKHYFSFFAGLVKPGAAVLLCIASASANATAGAQMQDTERTFNEAMAQYEQCKWSAAFVKLAELADRGHAESARIAWLMARYGPKLFGGPQEASPTQLENWAGFSLKRMVDASGGSN